MGPGQIGIEIHDTGPARPLGRSPFAFPDPALAGPEGLVAMGGDFAPGTIVDAYRRGIFPWPHPEEERLWFSPDPRAILSPRTVHVSRRLARTIRHGRFYVSLNAAFERVLDRCADRPEGTWITPGYRRGYLRLHQLGWAHSFEVWSVDGELAGGLYGLNVGGLFGAESMFHAATDASKVAMVAMAHHCQRVGVSLIDVQLMTPHLASMGARAIPRSEYLGLVHAVVGQRVNFCGQPGNAAFPMDNWALPNWSL